MNLLRSLLAQLLGALTVHLDRVIGLPNIGEVETSTVTKKHQNEPRAQHLRWHHATSMFARLTLRIRGSQETGLGLT